ncbi:rhodanese-like domain-containing protein [Luteolibacter algae]|uniref:Rhodanese-like domain-containing protein n=1 Tax=Luteolibacter algae TaxID=454151 RepID=A0ABW5D6H9_9BACT
MNPNFRILSSCGLTSILLTFMGLISITFAAEVTKLTPAEAMDQIKEGKAVLVDVREPSEWAESGVAEPAKLLAKSDFDGARKLWKPFLQKNKDKKIIVYCRSGARAGAVANALAEEGIDVANSGSLQNWIDAGLPIRKAEKK